MLSVNVKRLAHTFKRKAHHKCACAVVKSGIGVKTVFFKQTFTKEGKADNLYAVRSPCAEQLKHHFFRTEGILLRDDKHYAFTLFDTMFYFRINLCGLTAGDTACYESEHTIPPFLNIILYKLKICNISVLHLSTENGTIYAIFSRGKHYGN